MDAPQKDVLELVSFEKPESLGGNWQLSFRLPALFAQALSSPTVDITATSVRVESASGDVATASVPASCERIDQERATCRLQKRKGLLSISWPATVSDEQVEQVSRHAESLGAAASMESFVEAGDAAKTAPQASKASALDKAASRVSLDYSRFDGIDGEECCKQPQQAADVELPFAQPASTAVAAPVKSRRGGALDYSRFEEINEDDATSSLVELEKIWKQQSQLNRMRGESPASFADWQRQRAKQIASSASGSQVEGRGLWSRTNMEDSFAKEAALAIEEQPSDAELPPLPAPDLLSAMTGAPNVEVLDITKYARGALREELMKACATDRAVGCKDADVRVDAIVSAVDVGDGNAGICVDAKQFLCAYRFEVKVAYCVATSQRPSEASPPAEAKYMGDITISELASGVATPGTAYQEALRRQMKTSLREPKPPKRHLSAMRPVLERLELSLVHFIRRFERRLLAYPSLMKRHT